MIVIILMRKCYLGTLQLIVKLSWPRTDVVHLVTIICVSNKRIYFYPSHSALLNSSSFCLREILLFLLSRFFYPYALGFTPYCHPCYTHQCVPHFHLFL